MFDFIRVAAAVPEVSVGNVDANVVKIIEKAAEADKKGVQLTVFPELAITGYSCGDLFFQSSLLSAAKKGLRDIAKASEKLDTVIVVGLPFDFDGRLFNCAGVVFGGKVYARTSGRLYHRATIWRSREPRCFSTSRRATRRSRSVATAAP